MISKCPHCGGGDPDCKNCRGRDMVGFPQTGRSTLPNITPEEADRVAPMPKAKPPKTGIDEEALAWFNRELRRATLRLEMISAAAEDLVSRLNAVAKAEEGGGDG